ncbi:MinD/ParA family ATP-binding protein [Mycobacterium interjectum]|uniref:MinD/ParA family ATP-binding protein n=1 Tax=Mycobacterium interjectum TaxID=33895 RepID=UPI0021F3997E|nr:MinD/ParA family protein [Mycobacterium interjectum]MCV7091083.1 MinD/ParA family protein [Mycobacterium interjectum]
MSNRGSLRGIVQQPPASAGPAGPPGRQRPPPDWRANDDAVSPAVPQPPPTKPAPARRVPPRPRPELAVGGMALDGLDQAEPDDSARFNWRDLIRRLTGINVGPGKASAYERGLRDRIRTPVGGAFPIAVLNLKGGVGKTVVVEALGSTFAAVRDDRVVAVDIDAGDLAERHGRRNPLSMADLLRNDAATRYSDVRAHTYKNSFGLEVLGLPDYARTDWRLERHDVGKAFSVLRKHYSVLLVDCVKAVNSAVMDAVLPEARALVVVTSTSIDAIRKTKTTLDLLRNNGYQRLLSSTVLAINHVEAGRVGVVAAKELDLLSNRVAATVVLPFDRHVHDGKEIGLDRLSKDSRRSYLEMAAAIADMFPDQGAQPNLRLGARRAPHGR